MRSGILARKHHIILHEGQLPQNIDERSNIIGFSPEDRQKQFSVKEGLWDLIPSNDVKKPRYRISFIDVTMDTKNKFKHSKCILIVSIGQPAHEGEKLRATLESIDRHFNGCVILVADTLQRYNLAAHSQKRMQELEGEAKIIGDKWLQRNQDIIAASLKHEYKISRWNYWMNHEGFARCYEQVCKLYKNDAKYKNIIVNQIHRFLSRKSVEFDYDRTYQLSLKYLLEECAIMCLWPEMFCKFMLYPKGLNEPMRYINHILIEPDNHELMTEVGFQIRRIK